MFSLGLFLKLSNPISAGVVGSEEWVLFSDPVNARLGIFSLDSSWKLNRSFLIYFSIFFIHLHRLKKPINTVNILPENFLSKIHKFIRSIISLRFSTLL